MLSHSLTLNEGDDRGRGLSVVTPPVFQLVEAINDQSPPPGAPPPPSGAPPPAPPWSSSLLSSPAPPQDSSFLPFPDSLRPAPSSMLSPSPLHVHHHFSPLLQPPFPTPPSVIFTPQTISSPPVPPSLLPPPSPPPPAPPPYCSCSSLLPRLLLAHRLEVRRLLRGALASLSRRLDSLERISRRRMRRRMKRRQRGGAACSPGSSASSSLPPVTSSFSSSSDSEESPSTPLPSSFSRSERRRREEEEEEEEVSRRKIHRGDVRQQSEDEEDDDGRFVGRMAVSFRGGRPEEEAPLTLCKFNQSKCRKREKTEVDQSEKAVSVIMKKNGYSSLSQHALFLLQSADSHWSHSQSEALSLSSGQWRFSDITAPLSRSSDRGAFHLWLHLSSSSFSPAPMLRLSAVVMEMLLDSVRGGACWSPQRPLRDWTAPPSLSSDHCYVRMSTQSPASSARRQQRQRASHGARNLHLLRRRPLPPLPPCLANGLSAPLPGVQSAASCQFFSSNGERGKRVSQIRIRRASPRETPLTPMGLPKVKRLKKKEFSLEEIYTNKNYKSPSTNRTLETIFEEPREKDGALLVIGQQKRRRTLLFPDFTQPRKRKKLLGAGLAVAAVPRKRAAARRHIHSSADDDGDLDVMLVERLSALEDFLARQGLDV